jgi:hypothetical protein
VAGIVGAQAALALGRYLKSKPTVRPEDVVAPMSDKVRAAIDALSLQELSALNRQVLAHLEEKPAARKKAPPHVLAYLEHLKEGGRGEAVADFINLTERPEFARGVAVLLASPPLMELLTRYIEQVRL